MEADDATSLQRWVLQWRDLVEFEVFPVSPSNAVRELFNAGDEHPKGHEDSQND